VTAVVTVEGIAIALLAVLVAGLLRAYASVLARLHDLEGGGAAAPQFRTVEQVPAPANGVESRSEWTQAHDVFGATLDGDAVAARVVGAEQDTLLAFLSSGCAGCAVFWDELAEPHRLALDAGLRLLVVTKDAEEEDVAALARLCPPGVDLLMSSRAWADYGVPGSPFVTVVHGATGRVSGHGSAQSFAQLSALIGRAGGARPGGVRKSAADRDREADVDRELMAAGILPGDPSLYQVQD
jgi:hypothetical protein